MLYELSIIASSCNDKADDLSRNNLSVFLSKVPDADSFLSQVPPLLYNLLLSRDVDWLSPNWANQFNSIFNKV